MKKKVFIIILSIFILSACSANKLIQNDYVVTVKTEKSTSTKLPEKNSLITEPINDALTRVTKKPFGIKVSPKNSPVSPEKFSGYHTGTDFEINSNENASDVNIYTICEGPLMLKKYVTGYGGVAVQQCIIQDNDVTVLYGHLKLDSISASLKQTLTKEQKIGILGKGFSKETDGERKHLHLSIHKGKTINLFGYVANKTLLNEWIDPLGFIW